MSDGTIIVENGPALETATAESIADTRVNIARIQEQYGEGFPIYSEEALQLEADLSAVLVNFFNKNIPAGTPAEAEFVQYVGVLIAQLAASTGGFVESFKTTEEQKARQREVIQARLLEQLLGSDALPAQGNA